MSIPYSVYGKEETILSESALHEICKTTSGAFCNARYENFQPIMADGRVLLSSTNPIIPETILPSNTWSTKPHPINSRDNWEYRNFMTKHANSIRKKAFIECLQ